jgi:hypothetical protein
MFLDKIDVLPIVRAHFNTLVDNATGERSRTDIILFFGIPVIVGATAVWGGIRIRVSAVTAILTASAIFVGLLPNLLILVLSFLVSTKGESSDMHLQRRKTFMREIAANLSFSLVLSLVLTADATGALIMLPRDEYPIGLTSSFVLIAGSVMFGLTMLMLIRRIYALVVNELDLHKIKNAA